MRTIVFSFSLIFFALSSFAQFKTPTIDGAISPGEYGDHTQGKNRGGNWYCTWDDSNIYFAVEGANINEGVIIYIDVNPKRPVNSTSGLDGMLMGLNYDNAQVTKMPFAADFFTYVKNGYNDYQQSIGAGGWTGNSGTQNKITIATNGSDVREFAIPWSYTVSPWTGTSGRPQSFNFFAYALSSGGYVYNQVPSQNASGNIGTTATVNYYYTVENTNNNSSTAPFANTSFSSFDQGSVSASNQSFHDVTFRNTSGSLNNVRINNSLNLHSNSALTSNGLTLTSTHSRTGYIAPVSGSINGPITVERYIPSGGKRAWQLLAAPFASGSAPTLFNAWQEGGNATSGYGAHITQAGGSGADGFDASTTAYSTSVLRFDGTDLQPLSNTNVNKVTDNGAAHFLFVRGDRTININSTASSSNTTLRITGTVNTGNVMAGVPGSSFSLIPNPYPSAIDFEQVRTGNGSTLNTFYKYDANLKNYRVVERLNATTYQQTPSQENDNLGRYIESGSAFFIPATMQLNFTEAMKSSNLPAASAFKSHLASAELSINLLKHSSGSYSIADGIRFKFDDSHDISVNAADIIKLSGFYENIAIQKPGVLLSVEKTKFPSASDSMQLNLWNLQTGAYRLELNGANLAATDVNLFVKDAYLNTILPVDVTVPTVIDFAVDKNIPASFEANRFTILMTNTQVLSCDFAAVKASVINGKNTVSWTMCQEANITGYELQVATDGKNFKAIHQIEYQSNAKGSYSLTDALNSSTDAYYRVKALLKDGSYKYSNVVKVAAFSKDDIAQMAANPVKNGLLVLSVNKPLTAGIQLTVHSTSGQQVYQNVFAASFGNYIKVDVSFLPAGVYFAKLSANEREQQFTFIKE